MGGRKPQERKLVSKRHSEQQPQAGHSKSFKKDPTLSPEVNQSSSSQGLPTNGTGEENTMENISDSVWRERISWFKSSAKSFAKECDEIRRKNSLNGKKAKAEIDSLKEELSLKADELNTSKHFLDLEKNLSKGIQKELDDCKNILAEKEGLCEQLTADNISLEDERKIGMKYLNEAKLEIGDLKRTKEEYEKAITEKDERIKQLEEERAEKTKVLSVAAEFYKQFNQVILPVFQESLEEAQPTTLMLTNGVKQGESEN